jgi:hypothetical protein
MKKIIFLALVSAILAIGLSAQADVPKQPGASHLSRHKVGELAKRHHKHHKKHHFEKA